MNERRRRKVTLQEKPGKAQQTLESECDSLAGGEQRRREGEGRTWEAMRVESKPPSSPDFSVKDTVLKRWIACALSAKACPRQ